MLEQNAKYTNIHIENLENSEIEITGEISSEAVETYRSKALKKLNNSFTIDGFRPGHIPENVLLTKVGELGLLEEMAEYALSEAFIAIIRDNNINAIGQPHIAITKIAPKNPVEFKMTTATMPKIDLPDYKQIAKDIFNVMEEITIDQKEIDDAILQIRKAVHHHKNSGILGPDGKPLPSTETADENLPSLDDAMVASIGDFKDTADFTAKLKENIQSEKNARAKEKKRAEILEKIVHGASFPLPRPFVENEISKMYGQFLGDLEHAGIGAEEYLKQIKKTSEDLRKEWLPDAEKRARGELVLREIVLRENISVPENELAEATKLLMKRHAEATEENVRAYLQHILTNSKVFEFLEKALQ